MEYIGSRKMYFQDIESTKEIGIPEDPIKRVIGQTRAVEKVKIAIKQRRHLLLVGPPGIGKSMLAQALALHLPKPMEEIRVLNNPNNPERPLLEVVSGEDLNKEEKPTIEVELIRPENVPYFVAEQLGFRCPVCGSIGKAEDKLCLDCGTDKHKIAFQKQKSSLGDGIINVFEMGAPRQHSEVRTTQTDGEGNKRIVIYQRVEDKIRVIDQKELEMVKKVNKKVDGKVIVPINRIPFVHATGASETELLGDVRHDPYGNHPGIGTPAYLRVIPGAIHEAHEGVLFIDELPHMHHLQNFILTAMQEKSFPIEGRNPHSSGASVRVDHVPCDFIFVGACNIVDVSKILPPLRSRILGGGYEILLENVMPDTDSNRMEIVRFVAQEIENDGRVPHASRDALIEIIKVAKEKAFKIDGSKNSLSLRLRELGGLVRLAGDFAIAESSELIEKKHVELGILESKPIEHQIKERYGSVWKGIDKDSSIGLDSNEGSVGYG